MAKKRLCLAGCILHFVLAAMALAWIAGFDHVTNTKGFLIADLFVLIVSVVTGTAYLKLNLDKLLLKFEISRADQLDKIILISLAVIALCVVFFMMAIVAIYFFKNVKMEQPQFVRFTVLPTLSLTHLTCSAGSYLAYQYFENYT